jgi:hypothetical protein
VTGKKQSPTMVVTRDYKHEAHVCEHAVKLLLGRSSQEDGLSLPRRRGPEAQKQREEARMT